MALPCNNGKSKGQRGNTQIAEGTVQNEEEREAEGQWQSRLARQRDCDRHRCTAMTTNDEQCQLLYV